jgi:7-cyano-7-deazaguanine synthase
MGELRGPIAVLCSGGLDSAVLVVDLGRTVGRAIPVVVRAGHPWEDAEAAALRRFLAAVNEPRIAPVRELTLPMGDVYGDHWSMTGDAPAWHEPDERSEIRGRNLVLLAKTLVLAAIEGWPTIALGSLAGNPFSDATPAFFAELAALASAALAAPLAIVAPYRGLHKAEVVRRGRDLPLELTMSCAAPTPDGIHCGACSKCRERVDAFAEAGIADRTRYASTR